ncbi:MAG: hypothetical protein LBQ60_03745 [Bacteroidales bacterium]|jgi:superoxide reductase|nr:hypothetical protein [Bacteroidales bacterium]
MPRVFTPVDIDQEEKELRKDYFDRHTPHIICQDEVSRGDIFIVTVKMGEHYTHPANDDHYIGWLQLWNRETLLAEARYYPDALDRQAGNIQVDFHIVAPLVSMNLTAMSYCTKHGLWKSAPHVVKIL